MVNHKDEDYEHNGLGQQLIPVSLRVYQYMVANHAGWARIAVKMSNGDRAALCGSCGHKFASVVITGDGIQRPVRAKYVCEVCDSTNLIAPAFGAGYDVIAVYTPAEGVAEDTAPADAARARVAAVLERIRRDEAAVRA